MKSRVTQPINASSMADIAFLLLIFFIIATTIDLDQGIMRKLPPDSDEKIKSSKKRNTFVVLINQNNEIFVQDNTMNISRLRNAAKKFISNPYNEENLPEIIETDIPLIGKIFVTKNHVISLQNDRGTSYASYLAVQNELTAAYNELREELSLKYFKTGYEDLDDVRKRSVEEVYPLRISEANPVNVLSQN